MSDKNTDPGNWKKPAWLEKLSGFHMSKRAMVITVIIIAVAIVGSSLLVQHARRVGSVVVDDNGTTYKMDDNINFSMNNVKSTNPVNSTDEDTYYLSKLVYSSLFSLDEHMEPKEDLVQSYNFRQGQLRMRLRSAKFHDDRSLTAADVKFSIEAYKAASNNNYKEQVSQISSVETQGDNKVIINYNYGARKKVSDLTFPILPSHRYNGVYSIIYLKKIKMVGSGKYTATSYDESSGMKLKSYDEYYGEKADNTINVSILGENADKIKMTDSGNVSVAVTRNLDREAKISTDKVKIINYPTNKVDYIGFNFYREVMTDKNIRKAIASAIDNTAIIQEVFFNSAMLNDNLFYPGYLGIDSKKDAYPYSEAKAKKYLAKAGYKDRDQDGYVENKNMGEISLIFLVCSTGQNQQMANAIASNLQKIGIRVTVSAVPKKTYATWLKGTNYDMYLGEYHFNESMDMTPLLKGTEKLVKYVYDTEANSKQAGRGTGNGQDNNSGKYGDSGNTSKPSGDTAYSPSGKKLKKKESYNKIITGSNYTRYYSKKVNNLVDKINSGLNKEEMRRTYLKLKKELDTDLPYYTILYRTDGLVVSPFLKGDIHPQFWNIYHGSGNWKTKIEVKKDVDK